jgi:hypothetical protein
MTSISWVYDQTGGTVISIADDFGAFAFRMWGDETVIGPVIFSTPLPGKWPRNISADDPPC